ncbi:ABC transporter permease [Apilactobacillus timberlakei]|uniref:ABC transporter permease n=1 Tax=Apilactobacillus timberlakei TaxID=2008380 RepID=A0ABY2YUQ5_9LACO|nr:ABC transporter permease [Apilactobacillus timberlakei]TPR14802.1 hypothetical protein DYZ97_01310 [Apilactobacillus timberlakei]TPR15769.1 hypothetical protein DY052_04095 [Apilactobacillus timberlakei]TPR16130.1 hypothetical protein DY048_01310 [Apilactobacillus timberlakei]TPR18178.1 hypothetical protein DYZ95_02445 [Apilactobacillus timberlakei]TPR24961.1 hypothetical protein DY102_00620 [Apilactobacillus timberlakei]
MLTLLRQEIYKQIHGKFYIGWPIVMLLASLTAGYFLTSGKGNVDHEAFAFNIFNDNIDLVMIAMIVFASTIMIGDFANNTVKYLFSRQFSRLQIFISKLIVTVFMYIYLIAMSYIFTFITKMIFNRSGDMGMKYINQNTFGIAWLLLLLLPMVMLVSNIVKNNGVAIALGIVFFFASSMISGFSILLMRKWEILKFSPFNFLNVYNQFLDHGTKAMTHLSLTTMEIGTVVYALIFTAIAYVIYNHRNV